MGPDWWGHPDKEEENPLGLNAIDRIQGALLDFEPSLAVLNGEKLETLNNKAGSNILFYASKRLGRGYAKALRLLKYLS